MTPELWRAARPGEREDRHLCSDYCHDEERAEGLVRVPFDEAAIRLMRFLAQTYGVVDVGEAFAALQAALGEDTQ